MISNLQKVVAIVDDDPGMRKATAALLSASGYGTETFDSAEAILNAITTSKANCVLIDIQLGEISGVELARQLAAEGFKIPTIFMTGLSDDNLRSQAAAAGGIAFLNKPYPAQLLIEAIKTAIG